MPIYNFKKNVTLYVVSGGLRYKLDIYPDISFSQTFNEEAVSVKTLHAQTNMFDDAVITTANPANFNFTIPALTEADLKVVYGLLIDYDTTTEVRVKTFDIYVETETDVWRLHKCVFESGVFQIVKESVVTLALSGTASKLDRWGVKGTGMPGILQARSNTRTFIEPYYISTMIDGVERSFITSISLELKNEIEWIKADTLHKSLVVTSASDTVYPDAFVVSKRVLSGTIQQYVTDQSYQEVNSWNTNCPIRIRIGKSIGVYVLDFDIPSAVFTNRLDPQEVFIQSFDFRMRSNPVSLSTVIKI